MSRCMLGSVELSRHPRVVGTIAERRTLSSFLRRRASPCEIVELRLDKIGASTYNWLEHAAEIEKERCPVILTIRLRSEGGQWDESDEAREPLFRAALGRLAGVDVELQSGLVQRICEEAARGNKWAIVSYHNFEMTPDTRTLERILAKIRALPAAIPKVATLIRTESDIETLSGLLRLKGRRPVCVIGMGEMGASSRLLLPSMGSCLAYGYLDTPVAPGQMSCAELSERLGAAHPGLAVEGRAGTRRRTQGRSGRAVCGRGGRERRHGV